MRILLDTHIIIWHLKGDKRLNPRQGEILEHEGNEKIVSLISLWEIAIKVNIGKLQLQVPIDNIIPPDTTLLPLLTSHILQYQSLPLHHRDPFDRMLIAQAQMEGLQIMTDDPNFPLYDIKILL